MSGRTGWRRMRLRRADGRVYLERWGFAFAGIGGVYVHRMSAPDPGEDLHDHPWAFVTIPLWGGYVEERADTRMAPAFARSADREPEHCLRGVRASVLPFRPRLMRLDECHRIIDLRRPSAWTLVFRGPRRRHWGFYTPDGFVDEGTYDRTVRVQRRDLWNEDFDAVPRRRSVSP